MSRGLKFYAGRSSKNSDEGRRAARVAVRYAGCYPKVAGARLLPIRRIPGGWGGRIRAPGGRAVPVPGALPGSIPAARGAIAYRPERSRMP